MTQEEKDALAAKNKGKEKIIAFENTVFIGVESNIDCQLDVVAILSLQPESPEEIARRNKEMELKRKKVYDFEFMDNLKKELRDYRDSNMEFYKDFNNVSTTNFV